ECCEALEALALEWPVILMLEDLQWSDHSTMDLFSMIARRRESARLMLIGSYRPADVIVSGPPLRTIAQDLHSRRLSRQLWPDYLTESAIAEYLQGQFPDHDFPPGLSQLIHRQTGGNPLFVTAIVHDLLGNQFIQKHGGHWQFYGDTEKEVDVRPL